MTTTNSGSEIAASYSKLEAERSQYISRAAACAEISLPSLFPKNAEGYKGAIPTPHQGLGARGVKSLTNKLVQTLLPTATRFFRFHVSEEAATAIPEDKHAEVEQELEALESKVQKSIERSRLRSRLNEVIKLLLTTGNCVLYQGKDGVRYYNLHKYVVLRDGLGQVSRCIIKESVARESFPTEWEPHYKGKPEDTEVCVYTSLQWNTDRTEVTMKQEVEGVELPTSDIFPADECPWSVLRMIAADGEHYGRSFLEEHMGDLQTLETLTKAVTLAATAAARIIFLVSPNGTTDIKVLNDAENLSFVEGIPDEVACLQLDKSADLAVAKEMIMKLTKELEQTFLMHASATRNAERVTAAEVRYMAAELEQSLGGIYSVLAEEFQLPTVSIHLARLVDSKVVNSKAAKKLDPQIITGVEALGRNIELDRLRTLLEYLGPLGPEVIAANVNVADYIIRVATAVGLQTDGLVYTEEQKAAMQQQAQQEQATQMGAEAALKQA